MLPLNREIPPFYCIYNIVRWEMREKRKNRMTSTEGILSKLPGGQRGNRTPDTRIFSPLLYQLSYLSSKRDCKYKDRDELCKKKNPFALRKNAMYFILNRYSGKGRKNNGGFFLRQLRHFAYRDHIRASPSSPSSSSLTSPPSSSADSSFPAGKQALLNTHRHYLKLRRLIRKLLPVVFRVFLYHMNML